MKTKLVASNQLRLFLLYTCLTALLSACSAKPYAVQPIPEAQPVRSHLVYIVSHGWHTGLIISGAILNEAVPGLERRFGMPDFYEIGWGDKGFYQAQQITTGLTLQAMFWSEGAVLHLVAISTLPAQYFNGEPVISTCLSDNELDSLKIFLQSSFLYTPTHSTVPLRTGIYGNSQFYTAQGRYYLLNTCNKWIAKALKSAGLEIQPVFKLTSGSIMKYLEKNARPCTE
ncbi:TIGR02117 family protein [Desulfogranum japonicum]|uniref:TIGR02117 family protein n=1 Tax=Desulfogranum japonicum TaxID=231447 RepID=UPI00042A38DF|nr:TIGR02117 family protein [Desulfogranum japonicum]